MKGIIEKLESIGYERLSWYLILSGLITIMLSLILFLIGEHETLTSGRIKADKFGQFGDIIGGVVGSIWALAGVMLFYAAFKKQIEALDNQKEATQAAISSIEIQSKELQLQRKELEQTREVFKEQEKTLKIQQFESTFFNLISLLESVLNSIDIDEIVKIERRAGYVEGGTGFSIVEPEYDNITNVFTGRDCIAKMLSRINLNISNVCENGISREEVIAEFKEEYEGDIEPYLNLIKQVLIRIENCPLNDNNEYIDILKAQLTKKELKFMKIMTETDLIDNNFQQLIDKHNMFARIE